MSLKNLPKIKHGVIVDVDNYTNEHLTELTRSGELDYSNVER